MNTMSHSENTSLGEKDRFDIANIA